MVQNNNAKIQKPNGLPPENEGSEDGNEAQDLTSKSERSSFTELARLKAGADNENQSKKLRFPKAIFFIVGNEFCERFNYYGMRTTLVLFLKNKLGYTADTATVVFHLFTTFVYLLCVFGAIISDSWLGKFKTILYISFIYVFGSVMMAIGAVPHFASAAEAIIMLGLTLIAMGSGGIKPCVATFGGDQFKLPDQARQLAWYFSVFYMSINLGALISTCITPILRDEVHCLGENSCQSLAFGVPAILMIIALVVFIIGYPFYILVPPAGNVVWEVVKTIGNAISTRCKERKTNPRPHWLDYADRKHDKQTIADIKVVGRILIIYSPLPLFWALFDQQGSRWVLQAETMDGRLGSWNIKPDMMQLFNPLCIILFIPLCQVAIYPALSRVGIRRPLQKIILGGLIAALSFFASGILQLFLDKAEPKSIHMGWQIPQFVLITLAEIMVSVTALEFSYAQAPLSMKSFVNACWCLTIAFGNIFVAIITELKLFKSMAPTFFLYAGLMVIDMMILIVLAYYYKPNNPNEKVQQ